MANIRVASRSFYVSIPGRSNIRDEGRLESSHPVQYIGVVQAFQRQLTVRAWALHIVGGPDLSAIVAGVPEKDPVLVAKVVVEAQHQVIEGIVVDALNRVVVLAVEGARRRHIGLR